MITASLFFSNSSFVTGDVVEKHLINSNSMIEKQESKICIAGITDFRAHQIKNSHRSNPKKALNNVPNDVPKIVLAHQPNSIFSVHDWINSGDI